MRNGVPSDFWTDKGFDRIDEIFIAQKFEGIAARQIDRQCATEPSAWKYPVTATRS